MVDPTPCDCWICTDLLGSLDGRSGAAAGPTRGVTTSALAPDREPVGRIGFRVLPSSSRH